MILSSHGIIGSSIVQFAFDADYQAVLDYATTQGYTLPSASQQLLQNQLVVDLKDGSIWSKLDTFAVFATDGNSDFALIDWKRLSQYTAINSPTFTTNDGFRGNGTSAYIDTNFNISAGTNYLQNDASRTMWIKSLLDGTISESQILSGLNLSRNNGSGANSINGANAGARPAPLTDVNGQFRSLHRTSSSSVTFFSNLNTNGYTSTSVTIVTGSQGILRYLTTYSPSTTTFGMYAMGGELVAENTDFYNAWINYYNAL
jgi:hypothetical protein